jgi:GntR family transcriptional regulator, phosphonate transport system regulatory protein
VELNKEGVSIWRQISETLLDEIRSGVLKSGEQLPADSVIAERFGVNRHPVRRAVGHLAHEGILRVERGRGTYVVHDVLQYKLGSTTRFTANLLQNHRAPARSMLHLATLPAPAAVAEALEIQSGDSCVLLTVLGESDGAPLSLGKNYFPLERLPELFRILKSQSEADPQGLSITRALSEAGVESYRRRKTRISARLPSADEAHVLRMARSQPIIETESIDVGDEGLPITYARTSFRADRLQFVVGD